jgi:hypothetical protein
LPTAIRSSQKEGYYDCIFGDEKISIEFVWTKAENNHDDESVILELAVVPRVYDIHSKIIKESADAPLAYIVLAFEMRRLLENKTQLLIFRGENYEFINNVEDGESFINKLLSEINSNFHGVEIFTQSKHARKEKNAGTKEGIETLAKIRQDAIDRKEPPPPRIKACGRVPISEKTVERHAPELYERWNDLDYKYS